MKRTKSPQYPMDRYALAKQKQPVIQPAKRHRFKSPTDWHALVGHGGWVGLRSYIHRNPEQEILLVVLDNSSNEGLDEITETLVSFFDSL